MGVSTSQSGEEFLTKLPHRNSIGRTARKIHKIYLASIDGVSSITVFEFQ